MKQTNQLLGEYGTTIFTTMSALAVEFNAINLGQGFPDSNGPDDILDEAVRAIKYESNQYPSMMGIKELREATAQHSKNFYDIDLDWENQTMITAGATEAIASSLFGLINPGDEVIMIEPISLPFCSTLMVAEVNTDANKNAPFSSSGPSISDN